MSLPSIRTPSGERRQPFLHGVSGQLNDASTPRPPSQAHINMSPDEVLKYQEACFARDETPALTLQPPRSRHASVSGGGSGSVTPPGTESTQDDEHHSSPRSVGSGGSGSGSGSGGGSAASIRSAGRVYVPSNVSATSGGSPSAALWQMYSGAQGGGMSVPEPEPHLAKANMDLAGQLGTEQFLSLAGDIGATTGGTSLRPRPSFKRLASQSLGPDSTKSARVEGGDEAEDDVDAGFSIPRPPPFLAGHGRKRSNSSPSQSNSASNLAKLAMTGAGGVFNFHHGVPSLSPSPVPTVGLGIAHN
ncbi:hypothetical protein DL93DRAFT_1310614 [Clavulina sp. PMI_390]|nr:hypothetical protein DL93DRAFT_1310614 [Clavulina sp. PMI_390]